MGLFSSKFLADLGERVVATYIESFIGFLMVGEVFDLKVSVLKMAAVGAAPAALAVIKGAIASKIGDKGTAALVAPPTA